MRNSPDLNTRQDLLAASCDTQEIISCEFQCEIEGVPGQYVLPMLSGADKHS